MRVRLLLLAFALFLAPAPSARAQSPTRPDCNAAGCVPANWGPGQIAAGFAADDFRPGQTFTPRFTGVLSQVRIGLETNAGNPVNNAIAEIRATVNGAPTSVILAEAPVGGAPYTGGVLYAADFTGQNMVLAAGTRYALTLRCPTHQYVLASFPRCPPSTGTNDYYHSFDFGQTWQSAAAGQYPNDRSIIFEVCLDAATVTSPTTWGRLKQIYR